MNYHLDIPAFLLLAVSGCCKSITGVVPFILVSDDKTNYFIALSKFSHLVRLRLKFGRRSKGTRLPEVRVPNFVPLDCRCSLAVHRTGEGQS